MTTTATIRESLLEIMEKEINASGDLEAAVQVACREIEAHNLYRDFFEEFGASTLRAFYESTRLADLGESAEAEPLAGKGASTPRTIGDPLAIRINFHGMILKLGDATRDQVLLQASRRLKSIVGTARNQMFFRSIASHMEATDAAVVHDCYDKASLTLLKRETDTAPVEVTVGGHKAF